MTGVVRAFVVVLAWLSTSARATPLPPIPDTPAGRRAQAWLEVVRAADQPRIEAMLRQTVLPEFLQERMPIDELLDLHLDLARTLVQVHSVTERGSDGVNLLLQRTTGYTTVVLVVEPQPPHRVRGFGFMDAQPPGVTDASPSPDDLELARQLGQFVAALSERDEFSGAVLVARSGVEAPVYAHAFGLADKRWGIPNTLETRFNLGSANKLLTSIAINQLVEQGTISYDDTVARALPSFPNPDVRRRVTVRHLLTHTGGTGDHFSQAFFDASRLSYRHLEDFVDLIRNNGVAFEPGSQMRYSNAGFFILGLIVERASRQTYYDYLREHVLAPAGMTDTDCYDADIPVPDVAYGYLRSDEYARLFSDHDEDDRPGDPNPPFDTAWRENTFLHSIKGGPAGGGYSTVLDLRRLADALMSGRLVSPHTLDLMTTPHTEFAGWQDAHYGFGVTIETLDDGRHAFGHGGDFPGVQCRFAIVPDTDSQAYYVVAILTNYSGAAQRVYDHALRLLPAR